MSLVVWKITVGHAADAQECLNRRWKNFYHKKAFKLDININSDDKKLTK